MQFIVRYYIWKKNNMLTTLHQLSEMRKLGFVPEVPVTLSFCGRMNHPIEVAIIKPRQNYTVLKGFDVLVTHYDKPIAMALSIHLLGIVRHLEIWDISKRWGLWIHGTRCESIRIPDYEYNPDPRLEWLRKEINK